MKKILLILSIITSLAYGAEKKENAESKDAVYINEIPDFNASDEKRKSALDELHTFLESVASIAISNSDEAAQVLRNQQKNIKEKMIAGNIDLNIALRNGMTPLTYYSSIPDLNVLSEWLITNGADVNKESNDEIRPSIIRSPLKNAVRFINLSLTKFLIRHGADVNKESPLKFLLGICKESKNWGQERSNNWIPTTKELLINGANFKIKEIKDYLNTKSNDAQMAKKALNEIIQEIIAEYRSKIDNYNNKLRPTLSQEFKLGQEGQIFPTELFNIMYSYIQPINYRDGEIMDNIMQIRYSLGELSPIQREIYENRQAALQVQQAQPTVAAAAPIAHNQQAAAMQD